MIKEFPDKAPCAAPTFYRTYSRVKKDGNKESYAEVIDRTIQGLRELGGVSEEDLESIRKAQLEVKVTTSGRWMWVGGTEWLSKQSNHLGAFNCTSLYLDNKEQFFLTLDLLGQGSGVGAVIEREGLDKLEPFNYKVKLSSLSSDAIGCKYGTKFQLYPESKDLFDMDREDSLLFRYSNNQLLLVVGDSRLGWVDAYRKLWSVFIGQAIDTYGETIPAQCYQVIVDYSFVRPEGTPIKGFGGKAQPNGFPVFLDRVAQILNEAASKEGRISTKQASLLCCEAGKAIVAGGVRRCLPAGTKVMMADASYRNIEDISVGDLVVGVNGEEREVLNFFEQGKQCLYQVDTSEGSFRCTPEHKIWVDTEQGPVWVEARALVKGDLLVKKDAIDTPSRNVPVDRVFLTAYSAETYDIEVDVDHAFFADNFLVSNSAEWHGFDSSDDEGNSCKDNLWVEIEGKWIIDPERDAFRMANHTRIYHHRPTLDEIKESVSKQHASGEGAIMFAPESIARCNNDVLPSRIEKNNFIQSYVTDKDMSRSILSNLVPNISDDEISHRMKRYLANPCLAPGTIVLTSEGYFPIETLLSRDVEVFDGKEWRKTRFRITGFDQRVSTLKLTSGEEVLATPYHTFILEDGTERKLSDLKPGDKLLTHKEVYNSDYYASDEEIESKISSCAFPNEVLNWSIGSKRSFMNALYVSSAILNDKNLLLDKKGWAQGLQILLRSISVNSKISSLEDEDLRRIFLAFYEYILDDEADCPNNVVESVTPGNKYDAVYCCTVPETHRMSLSNLITGQCVEIIGHNLVCNLSLVHLESMDPNNEASIREQFRLAALAAVPLLKYNFSNEVLQKSRELDPIVAVCFTGLFDFLVAKYKEPWLQWWMAGRPTDWGHLDLTPLPNDLRDLYFKDGGNHKFSYLSELFTYEEAQLFSSWKKIVSDTVTEYCEREGLKVPNRVTAIQPSGTKGLLSGGAPGWHPSYAQYYIRRITFGREDPVAMACMSYGYNIIPGVDSKKEDGSLYDDIWDPNVSTWLVEIPIKAPWSELVDGEWPVEDAHVHSRWDLYMQVQRHYSMFNTSATINFKATEIDDLSQYIYDAIQNNEGYVSAALLAGEKYTFPRMPYEKISKEEYEAMMGNVLSNRVKDDFLSLLEGMKHEQGEGPGGCSSDKCEIAFRPRD